MEVSLLIITTILTALVAGLFYGYSVSVNGALGRLRDGEYIRAVQQITIVIQNPLFFLIFMGPLVLLPIVTFLSWDANDPLQFYLLLASTLVYISGSFILTIAGNLPYSERLGKLDVARASIAELATARLGYEKPWNAMHTVRTIASVASATLLVIVCTM